MSVQKSTCCPSFERQKVFNHNMDRIVFLFLLLFALCFAYQECSMEGYEEYLAQYDMKCGDDCDAYKKWF